MKVALIGSHGVGKTTLCFELAARLKRRDVDVEMVREVARHCPLPINRETSLRAQAWILHTQMAWEIEAEAAHELVLCDRSVLDNYCYLHHAAGRRPEWDPLLADWLRTYDLLVRVPINTPPRWDGVRDTDSAFQEAIQALLDGEVSRRGLDTLTLDPAGRDHWGDAVMARLEPIVFPMPPLFPDEDVG